MAYLGIFYRIDLVRDRDILKEGINYNLYNGIVLDAHVYELFKNAFSKFLYDLLLKRKHYIIDPVTYRFGLPEQTPNYAGKRWFSQLLERYGLQGIISEEEPFIDPTKLSEQQIKEITKNVIEYQQVTVPNRIKNVLGMLAYIGEIQITSQSLFEPKYIIPPYLIISDYEDIPIKSSEILSFNIKTINYACSFTSKPIMAIIPIDKMILMDRPEQVFNILNKYLSLCKVDAYGIWITDMDETKPFNEAALRLVFYIFLYLKSKSRTSIWNMYGGFFSIILMSLGIIDHIVHGVGYAEYRNPFTEGGPIARRYYNHISHKLDPIEKIIDIYSVAPQFKCTCPICKTKDLRNFKEKDLGLHFLFVRFREYRWALTIRNNIKDPGSPEYLETLKNALQEIIELIDRDITKINKINEEMNKKYKLPIYIFQGKPLEIGLTPYSTEHLNMWQKLLNEVYQQL